MSTFDTEDSPPTLRDPRITLRRVVEGDKTDRLMIGRDADAVRMYGGDWRTVQPFTEADAERWYQHQLRNPHAWVMEVRSRCIGGIFLHSLNLGERRASVAIGINDPSLRGLGLGTRAMRLVLGHAFETLQLHRVSLRVLEFNARAIASYKKCGFVREGIERETAFVDGAWRSDVIMGILEHDYRALVPSWAPPSTG